MGWWSGSFVGREAHFAGGIGFQPVPPIPALPFSLPPSSLAQVFTYNPPMRDEQYYALAKLLRRPMRRWWARVGSWWLAGLGLLLMIQVAQAVYFNQAMQADTYLMPGDVTSQAWYKLIQIFTFTSLLVSVGLALLCALNVIAVVDRTTHQTLAFNEAALRAYKYKLALLNCWPALVPIFSWSTVFSYNFSAFQFSGTSAVWSFVSSCLYAAFPLISLIVWLVAVAVVTLGTRWQVWYILFCSKLPLIFVILYVNGFIPGISNWSPYYGQIEFSDLERTVFKGIGLGLVYLLFFLYYEGRTKLGNVLCIMYGTVLLLGCIGGVSGIYIINYILMAGMHLEESMRPLGFYYSESDLVLRVFLGSFRSEFPAGPAWVIAPVLNGIFWLFAHYFAFSWLMRRKVRGRIPTG